MRRRNAAVRNVLIEHGKAEPLQQNLPEAEKKSARFAVNAGQSGGRGPARQRHA